MKITKLGHCCLLLEILGKRLLTDPGLFTPLEKIVGGVSGRMQKNPIDQKGVMFQNSLTGFTVEAQNRLIDLDAIFITHEHPDHLHMESVKAILQKNPKVKIFAVSAVAKILSAENIASEILGHGQNVNFFGISVEAYGQKHAEIYKAVPRVENTGYLFDNRFWYPGDAFTIPPKPVEILALPVAGPWMKSSEALDYALELLPKSCFPVHDGFLKIPGAFHALPQKFLGEKNIRFETFTNSQSTEF